MLNGDAAIELGSPHCADEDYFDRGIALFNRGRFFECHEEWEKVWKRSTGQQKIFRQGLIQAAVALLHIQRGNLRGAASLYAKARAKLDGFPGSYAGIALDRFRADLDAFITAALANAPLPQTPEIIEISRRS
jgi:predicted metal-dependent hydrolase